MLAGLGLSGSPVVELNRAVAVSMAYGPAQALPMVEALEQEPALRGYHLLWRTNSHNRAPGPSVSHEGVAPVLDSPDSVAAPVVDVPAVGSWAPVSPQDTDTTSTRAKATEA